METFGTLTFYTGTETQLPDPTIEAEEGAGNVPAWRGSTYAVLQGLVISKTGGQIPNFEAPRDKANPYRLAELMADGEKEPREPDHVRCVYDLRPDGQRLVRARSWVPERPRRPGL